ncbi:hypothetical protein GCM10010371_39650 [Streptomyces subrutilus]|uniref:DUF3558 domain-containing protein n=2 Tax=Streptomyces subrutilus TaxID=36818 RepID=A0A918V7K4_9ACTN|nr:hypothetical protein GCM10010371_39650 [Streptomyces subrutilus]
MRAGRSAGGIGPRRVVRIAAFLVGGMLLVGCSGGAEPAGPPEQAEVSAGGACPEGMLNPDAVSGVERVTGTNRFQRPDAGENPGVTWVAGVLARGYAKDRGSLGGRACEVTPSDEKNRRRVSVSFEIQGVLQRTGEQSESGKGYYWEYALGRNALALSDRAKLFFDCASARLAGADTAVPVAASVTVSHGSDGDDPRLREANLAVVHSAARALAAELGCKDGGGLPEKLTVQEKSARTR